MSVPLPEGAFHLMTTDDDLARGPYCSHVALCGAVLTASSLSPSYCPEGGKYDRDPRFCLTGQHCR